MINLEIQYIVLMATCGSLFALGGTTNKAWRRYALPGVILCFLMFNGYSTLTAVLSVGLLAISLTLGYGEGRTWFARYLVGLAMCAPSLLLGYSYWVIIGPILWLFGFMASNYVNTAKDFPWKIIEMGMGIIIAITYLTAIAN